MGTGLVVTSAIVSLAAALTAGHTAVSLLVGSGCIGVGAAALASRLRSRPEWCSRRKVAECISGLAVLAVIFTVVSARAHQDLAGLDVELPARMQGIAEIGSDPQASQFGTRFELVLDGRRWSATAGRGVEGGVSQLRTGDRVRVQARVRPLDDAPRGWVLSRHLAGRLEVSEAEQLPGTRPWYRGANAVHELLERGAASMDPEHRALYLGLAVGDDRRQSELTRFHFRASGLTHLLAVSGQNLVFVFAVLSPLSRRLTLRARWVLGVAAVLGFVLVTRAEPSVLRAATMAVLGLTASGTGRRVSGIRLLGLAVVLLLVGDPMLAHSVGFRLSVAATGGLVLFTRRIEEHLVGPPALRLPLAVTLAAQLGAVPVMAATFGKVSVVAIPANLLAEPAAAAVMTLGLSTGLLSGLVREELAWVLQVPVRLAVWWVDTVATLCARLSLPPSGVVAWAVLVGCSLGAIRLWRTRGHAVVGRSVALAVLPMVALLRPPLPGAGAAPELPVGAELRGECSSWVLVLGPGRLQESAAVEILEGLWRVGVSRVDAVVVDAVVADSALVADGRVRSSSGAANGRGPAVVAPGVGASATGVGIGLVAENLRAPVGRTASGRPKQAGSSESRSPPGAAVGEPWCRRRI